MEILIDSRWNVNTLEKLNRKMNNYSTIKRGATFKQVKILNIYIYKVLLRIVSTNWLRRTSFSSSEFRHHLYCCECVGNGTIRDYRRGTVITIQGAEKELVFRAGHGGGEV